MLNDLIDKFKNAEGRSEFVIIVVCDIRNFSGFSGDRQAPEIAIFIAKFYEKMLSEYFTEAAFAKPTGDGLIMAFRHNKSDLLHVAETVLSQCQKAVNDFPSMFSDELMINFPLPKKIGFGVARGTAFCLFAGDEIIDYSGQILNLASRLNDFAKPSGIVIDEAFLEGAIPNNLQSLFRTEAVYIRGISEDSPRKVFCSKGVVIPESAKHPLNFYKWEKKEVSLKYANVKKIVGNYMITLPKEPLSKDKFKIKMIWPSKMNPGLERWIVVRDFTLGHDAEGFSITFDMGEEKKNIESEGLKSNDLIRVVVHYVPKIELSEAVPAKAVPAK